MEDYDNQVLQQAQDLCKVLNLVYQAKRILWVDPFFTRDKIGSDECRFGLDVVAFPGWMRKRLEPTEWRPLITSSLIFRKLLAPQMPWGIWLTAFVTFWIMIIGGGVFAALFGRNAGTPFLIYTLFVVVPFVANRIKQARKKQSLKADFLSTKVVEKEVFMSVLRKIDGMGLKDVIQTENRGLSRHFSSKPSVAERMSNLSRIP
jgi:hypothetical protein